jgi:hypothetical protein
MENKRTAITNNPTTPHTISRDSFFTMYVMAHYFELKVCLSIVG